MPAATRPNAAALRRLCTRLPGARPALRAAHPQPGRIAIGSVASAREASRRRTSCDFLQQPSACKPYVAMHGRGRGAALCGDLIVGQAAEVVELDDLREAGLHLLQTLQGIIEGDDVETGHSCT